MPTPHAVVNAEGLDSRQRGDFARDGFLVIRDFAPPADRARLIARAGALIDAVPEAELAAIFTTTRQGETTDRYFLESGDQVRFFLEEGAVDGAGRLRVPKARAINKIGHALHDLDPVFAAFSRDRRLAAMARDLGLADPRLLQSMVICKPPAIGGEVVCHQDATFLYTDPISVIGFWFALEDATIGNGCLWAIPGGHHLGLKRRFKRAGAGVAFDEMDAPPWPPHEVPVEAPAGTLVLLHGLLPHRSGPNLSARSRLAYSLHVIDGRAHYPADNWLQRATPVTGF